MDTTFYDEPSRKDINVLKRRMTLDLDGLPNILAKRQKVTPIMLTSPDLHMLKLATPELERLIISQNGQITTTPTPTQYIFSKNIPTDDQEGYAKGFVDALNQLHKNNNPSLPKPVEAIKEEAQTVPNRSASPLEISPIVLEDQEKMKLERKRLRNRLAASKCRRKKLERISQLEDKVSLIKDDNSLLNEKVLKLREQVDFLKLQIVQHLNHGCDLPLTAELSSALSA